MIAGPIDIPPVFFLGGDRCVAERHASLGLRESARALEGLTADPSLPAGRQ